MTTLTDIPRKTTKGTAFLMEESAPQDIFTPEDLSEEHLAVGRMVDEFWANEVEPNLPAIREKKPGVAMAVLRKSVELGLTAMAIPEEYGGMAMDLPSCPTSSWKCLPWSRAYCAAGNWPRPVAE